MATSNSSNTASRAAQNVEYRTSVYEAAALAQNEVVEMIEVYPGDTVVDVILEYDALGSTTSISVGDGGSAARFISAVATTSAGRTDLNTAPDVGRGYKYTAADTIDFKVVNTGAITGTVRVTALIMRTGNV